MKKGTGIVIVGLGAVSLSLSGCYTVLSSPYAADDAREDARYARWEEENIKDGYAPTIGRFDDRDRWDSPYDYGRQGFPVFGYNSQYGAYGMEPLAAPTVRMAATGRLTATAMIRTTTTATVPTATATIRIT